MISKSTKYQGVKNLPSYVNLLFSPRAPQILKIWVKTALKNKVSLRHTNNKLRIFQTMAYIFSWTFVKFRRMNEYSSYRGIEKSFEVVDLAEEWLAIQKLSLAMVWIGNFRPKSVILQLSENVVWMINYFVCAVAKLQKKFGFQWCENYLKWQCRYSRPFNEKHIDVKLYPPLTQEDPFQM